MKLKYVEPIFEERMQLTIIKPASKIQTLGGPFFVDINFRNRRFSIVYHILCVCVDMT